ncbi:MAG: S9 family peptidase [Dysgonamonadaceae bacterium]|jgi:dipeptidyl-peptidase-4|nr:S9 family peptidase [Dysgonamonadaceae bacterium]
MRQINLLFAILFLGLNIEAQNKTFTLEDLIPGGKNYPNLAVKTDYRVQWFGDKLVFSDEDAIYAAEPEKPDNKRLLITKQELGKMLGNDNVNLNSIAFGRGKKLASIGLPRENKFILFNPETREIAFEQPLNREWEHRDFCYANNCAAFTVKNNLFIVDANGKAAPVAEDANEGIVYGQSVHRNEFGINKGTFWSPSGNFLAFYRMDETMVGDYPLVNISAREAELKNIKYPMAGMASHEVTLGIYSIATGRTVYMKTGEPRDHYLTNIVWDPTEKYVYIAELNREQNHLRYNKYDAATGELAATLFEERNEHYVEPQKPALFLTKTGSQFVWQSRRDGYDHLYLYNTDGKLLRQLTSGNFETLSVLGFDAEEKNLFIVTNEGNPVENQVYKVELKTGKRTLLTKGNGVHSPALSASGKYFIDRFSNLETPLNIDLYSTSKPVPVRLQTAENPYKDYVMPEITLGKLKAADGKTDLYYHLAKPTNFDPKKKYPAVVYVYGGPHSQMIKNNWLASLRGWSLYMAQMGYVVFSMDNRGTSNRGMEFESVTHRHLGIEETADQMCGAEFLKSLPYVDAERIGVHGWSFGGFMTTNLMLRHPETFKVGVAGGPVIDWKLYEVMYGERYMDTPEENPDGYRDTDMKRLAGNLKGHFLLIHGDIDPTVVWQNSLSFLDACIVARTYPDYFVYPGQEHNMTGPSRVHLHEKITRYFEDYLK